MRSKSTIHTIYRASVACFIFGAGVSLFGYLSSSSLWYVGAGLGILGLLFDMAALLYRKCELDSSAQGFRAFLDNAFSIEYLLRSLRIGAIGRGRIEPCLTSCLSIEE